MGTRASFFIGNPSDVASRQWLGCVAYDGYTSGDCGEALVECRTPEAFATAVKGIQAERKDFCDPDKHSFPFPWKDDLYLTDYTYAFFDGRVQVTPFHSGWRDLTRDMVAGTEESPWGEDDPDELPDNVPAPENGDKPNGPDSIMIVSVRD